MTPRAQTIDANHAYTPASARMGGVNAIDHIAGPRPAAAAADTRVNLLVQRRRRSTRRQAR